MDLALVPTTAGDAPTFSSLMQLYMYDFSEFMGLDVGADGRFKEKDVTALWRDARRHPFFIRVDGQLAGFAIVDEHSRLFPAPANDMAEFFVLRKYRRLKVGSHAAMCAFDRFTGRWEVRQMARNTMATAFWRQVIGAYSGGSFQELAIDDERWRGPVQIFTSRTPLSKIPPISWSPLNPSSEANRRGPTGDVFGGPSGPTETSQGRGTRAD